MQIECYREKYSLLTFDIYNANDKKDLINTYTKIGKIKRLKINHTLE